MLHTLTSQIGLIALILVTALAMTKGGPAERLAALMVLFAWVAVLGAQAISGDVVPAIPLLVTDALLATGLLALAIRYASLWLGAAMMFQAAFFTFHMLHQSGDFTGSRLYLAAMNVVSYCLLITLAGASIASWRKRLRASKAGAPREQSPGVPAAG
jgi:hypothetical protein